MLWADSDPVLPLAVGERFAEAIGRAAPRVIEDASHFLQEDQGPLIGALIAEWLTAGLSSQPRRGHACAPAAQVGPVVCASCGCSGAGSRAGSERAARSS